MGCLPLVVTTHFCLTRGSKQCATTAPSSQSERHLTVRPLQLEISFHPTALSYSTNFLTHQVHLTCTIGGFKKLDILNLNSYEYSDKNYRFKMSLVPANPSIVALVAAKVDSSDLA